MKRIYSNIKLWMQLFFILLFSTLLVSCQGNTITPNTLTSFPSLQPTPIPTDAFFPQQSGPDMYDTIDAFAGKLVLVDGCLRLQNMHKGSYLVIWSLGFRFDRSANPMQVYDDSGQVVARVGDYIEIPGAKIPSWDPLPDGCSGPYWLMSASTPTLIDTHFPQAWALIPDPATATLAGKLVFANGCLRLQVDEKSSFLLIWPRDFSLAREKDPIQVYGYFAPGASGFVGQVGNDITVTGREILPDGLLDYTFYPIPNECSGPYWGLVTVNSPSPDPSIPQATETVLP